MFDVHLPHSSNFAHVKCVLAFIQAPKLHKVRLPKVLHHVLYMVSIFRVLILLPEIDFLQNNPANSKLMSESTESNLRAHLNRQRRAWFSTANWLMQAFLGKEIAGCLIPSLRHLPGLPARCPVGGMQEATTH